ncbi:indole-3-glycerol phosphate synthase [Nonlabens dokdonensis]|uniref:Indole-3-glycerol phosphate synthase n=2 Tax=Nonlabens dokdonensis TaxID=328515 RepID=L7W6G6_NONDD|nr:indole-3-glycerol phosphate synthase TrpC [Nonlabens dokdonensis]AGC75724.1 indole-3-glycerol phosphate synthase, IGPS [Nonlabens dokdonensis DSW-6]PZX43411.1 indole-3-glycerol phosphate synthase [Nonlabens dokdonensis]
MEDILKKITNQTAEDLKVRKDKTSLSQLREMHFYSRKTLSLYKGLKNGSGIIAEHKRQSPSKGSFNCPASLQDVVKGYEAAGASAISCLTDEPFFGGTLQDLLEARKSVNIPILRKDFIIDLYQIHEAKAYGADAILLIAACLNNEELIAMSVEAMNLGLEILFEVHDLEELNRIKEVTSSMNTSKFVIGVNNRDLKKFKTDIQNSKDLLPHFPENVLAISESGISDPQIVKELKNIGFEGFLIGENFMKTDQPGTSCKQFIKAIQS